MQISLVLTVLGNDRPGLVQALSEVLAEHRGNWEESRMVDLAGKFAGLLSVTIAADKVDDFMNALNKLREKGLNIQAERNQPDTTESASEVLKLEVIGPDAPGIINNISEQLARMKVNLVELATEQRLAPMSGEKLFIADMTLGLPAGLTGEEVQDALEDLADQLLVDFNFG